MPYVSTWGLVDLFDPLEWKLGKSTLFFFFSITSLATSTMPGTYSQTQVEWINKLTFIEWINKWMKGKSKPWVGTVLVVCCHNRHQKMQNVARFTPKSQALPTRVPLTLWSMSPWWCFLSGYTHLGSKKGPDSPTLLPTRQKNLSFGWKEMTQHSDHSSVLELSPRVQTYSNLGSEWVRHPG